MTTDPPETRVTAEDVRAAARVNWGRVPDPPAWQVTIERPPKLPPEKDPSNLNDPKLQRFVIAFVWGLTLALLGTCVAGNVCLISQCGAPQGAP